MGTYHIDIRYAFYNISVRCHDNLDGDILRTVILLWLFFFSFLHLFSLQSEQNLQDYGQTSSISLTKTQNFIYI